MNARTAAHAGILKSRTLHMASTKILNIGCTTQALYNQGPRALSYKHQASGLTGPWIWDTIGLMQACSAAQCERSGSGINTMIKPGLQVGPGIPSSLISFFSLLKLQAPSFVSHKLQASSPKHKGSSFKPQAASSRTVDPS
jgi:hypothetical protein